MKPSKPKPELPPSTYLRKAVFGDLQLPSYRIAVRFLTIGSLVVTLMVGSTTGAVPAKRVQFTEIALPKNVYSIAGEARAFQAKGPRGSRGQAEISVAKLRKQVGDFKTARVFAFDTKRRPAGVSEVKVSSNGRITLDATDGFQYVIYPDLNPRIRPTYETLCQLGKLGLSKVMISKVCEQILCTDQFFPASDLGKRVNGLDGFVSGEKLGNKTIGGFNRHGPRELPIPTGGGTICDNCMPEGFFYPADGCIDVKLSPEPPAVAAACGANDRVVYSKASPSAGVTGFNIRVIGGDGSGESSISSTDVRGIDPDVNLAGNKIVFVKKVSGVNTLFTVNIDGSGVAELPGTAGATSPVWGRGAEPFIVFTAPVAADNPQTAIWRASPSGTGKVQVTSPSTGQNDDMASVFDGKYLVFVREKQLWMQETFDSDPPPTQLTNIANAEIRNPVCGHIQDDRILAFIVHFTSSPPQPDEIRVSRLNFENILENLHTIHPGSPVKDNIFGIDFSANDRCMFFEATASDVQATTPGERFELFRISLDGSSLTRLTTNTVRDCCPSVITGSSP